MISDKLFVTCDFALARIRRIQHNRFEFIVTAPEFYEFMLPYLFLAELPTSEPVETPSALLAAVVAQESSKSQTLSTAFNRAGRRIG